MSSAPSSFLIAYHKRFDELKNRAKEAEKAGVPLNTVLVIEEMRKKILKVINQHSLPGFGLY